MPYVLNPADNGLLVSRDTFGTAYERGFEYMQLSTSYAPCTGSTATKSCTRNNAKQLREQAVTDWDSSAKRVCRGASHDDWDPLPDSHPVQVTRFTYESVAFDHVYLQVLAGFICASNEQIKELLAHNPRARAIP
jgi:hypothetical protein